MMPSPVAILLLISAAAIAQSNTCSSAQDCADEAQQKLRDTRVGKLLGPQTYSSILRATPYRFQGEDNDATSKIHVYTDQSFAKPFFACLTQKSASTHWMQTIRQVVKQAPSPTLLKAGVTEQTSQSTHDHSIKRAAPSSLSNPAIVPTFHTRPSALNASILTSLNDEQYDSKLDLSSQPLLREELAARAAINDPAVFNFAIVRHPWKRLVSGFRNKYYNACKGTRRCFSVQYKLPELLADGIELTAKISFHEFVVSLHASTVQRRYIDPHFRPTSRLCEVSSIKYDYIGELDNIPEMDFLAASLGATEGFFSDATIVYNPSRGRDRFPCTKETVDLVAEIYAEDIAAFGYSLDDAYHSCETLGQTS